VVSAILTLGHPDIAEAMADRLAEWLHEALHAVAPELLQAAAVDHVGAHARGHVPDVLECDHGELAAPAGGDGDAAQQRHQLVAAALAAVEALVGVLPHAVDGVGALGLAQHVVEAHLDMVVQIVGVPVDEINFFGRHDGRFCE